ncbi:MAG TPA: DUF192 domain-containing protein [Methanobacteriales archaeon]|nr:MAG: hypothetical protein XD44_0810 [Methanobacteriaceae archaeon 41_258]MBC7089245.1 DUF192 domain-containing protein [Methanobacteriaceae archaeon]MBC7097161.1 DUF192 domain-containing protein [Methanobacteriales archaeon]MDI3484184.1 uncharacterized protein [Methanobacteriaceae archaeon]HIH61404.1 DUF192 domain-containing protein [Methanobacteriales archaeon]
MTILKVLNKTRNECLGNVKIADTFISRFKGLMFKKDIKEGLLLKMPEGRGRGGSSIHMFFMRISLDVIFLDAEKRVVDLATLKPWQVYIPNKPAKYIIELPQGSIADSGTRIGDIIEFYK